MKIIGALLFTFFATICTAKEVNDPAQPIFSGKLFMTLVLNQEKDGKRGFHLTYKKGKKGPAINTGSLAGYEIKTDTFNFVPGMQTLLYKFNAKGPKGKRKIFVLYNGLLSLIAENGFYFYIAEEYEKSIRYYAMFDAQPSLEQVTSVIESALADPDTALVATRWEGKESSIFIYDSERLSK